MLDLPQKIFFSCHQISLEQVLQHFFAPLNYYVEQLIVDIGVFIEFINVGVCYGYVGIYTGQVLSHVLVCVPFVYYGIRGY